MNILKPLKKIVNSPFLNIIVALLLLYTGISESIHEFKDLEEFRLGIHHGVTVFAALQVLKSLPDFVEGVERIIKKTEDRLKTK